MNNQMVQINLEQAARLKELGYYLQQLRQKQHLSLQTVATKTLIPVRLLTAIEAGNLEQLPEPVYVQGFIRRYADAIGMNGLELASAFPTQTDLRIPKPSWRSTVQAQLRPLHLYLLYMLLVIGAVSGLSYLLNSSSTPRMAGLDRTAKPMQTNVAGTTGTQSGLSIAQSSAPSPSNLPSQAATSLSQKPIRVDLTMTSQSWLRIVVDGKTAFEGVLPEGTQRSWEGTKQVSLRAGNAGGVMVSLNNATAKRLGEPGAVEEVTFGSNAQSTTRSAFAPESEALTASNAQSY